VSQRSSLERFVPRIAAEWDLDAPDTRARQIDGTLCFVDISGFTNLSEKLARRGRIGAEELTEVLDRVFGEMLRLAYDRGGSLLKFGGDALLLMFEDEGHAIQAASAAVEMRSALRQASTIPTSVGRIPLRMSVGLHTGSIDLYLVGDSHRELVITGATATTTTEMEGAADAGDILVSANMAAVLPSAAIGARKGPGFLLRWRTAPTAPVGPQLRRQVPIDVIARFVPTVLRSHLIHGEAEPEHRVATVAFVKFRGTGEALDRGGPVGVTEALNELVSVVQAAADQEGVTFLASDVDADGGKIILTTGAPDTQVDDEGRMLRAVRLIADAGTALPLRIGVNRGHVFAGEIGTPFRSTYTVMGDTVNLAARLMTAAPAGGVYVAPAVLDRSRTLYATEALEPFHVKGKSEPVQALSVGPRPALAPSRPTPICRS
jgi:class 3 adenylate cyclase